MKTKAMLLACASMGVAPRAFGGDLNFDATQVAPDTGGGDVLPVGWYNAQIDESEIKPTASGTGSYLKLRFAILDGAYAGRKVFTQLNLKNENQQTVEIARAQLSAICHAVKVLRPGPSTDLHGIPLKIKLKVKAASGDYDARNEIQAYKDKDAQVDMAGGESAGASAFGAGSFGSGAPQGFGTDAPTPTPAATTTQAPDTGAVQPWSQPATAALASTAAPEAAPSQPWTPPASEQVVENTPAAPPPPPPAAPAAPAVEHDPLAAAAADGWIKHPTAPGYHYKGQDVKLDADVAAMYPAPAPAAPEAPAAPPPPPAAPAAPTAAGSAPSSTTAPTAASADPAAAAAGASPPWLNK